ncbi:MAG TPA: NADH-quinone oxidoreductase subunit NuoH [Candidatus Kapabacteria bacterium]|mgnify:FL=1|nr:NADH-quinone oxidoreductase subunit NuoH [Candidatus Kapabacteria bacterium]HPP39558.1 NADH-quinone oxidoreductase subunit NuoH [Candidatus Kapabacteria bacterium]
MENLGWILLEASIKAFVILNIVLLGAAASVYLERKVSAAIQDRIGPNRVGPFGILQPFADVFKLFFKEDIVPRAADKFFHALAPVISLGVAIAVYAVIPFAHYVEINGVKYYLGIAPDVNVGFLFILAMTSVGVYGITLAGWSSNNKYSLMGGLRSSAQMISYELSLGLSLIGVVLISGSFSLNDIVLQQSGWKWNVFLQPLGFIIFLVSAFAETNRAPFDLPEAEPELVGGYNTEYSGMKFGMFFLAEYANMATSSAFMALLYFGGWQLPFPAEWLGLQEGSIGLALAQFATFMIKVGIFVLFFIWVRWSVPRFRYDQLMNLGWKVLLPLSLLNVILTSIGVLIFK